MREASVERLCRRLAEMPVAFLRPVEPRKSGMVQVDAIVRDLFLDRATRTPTVQELNTFQPSSYRHAVKRKARQRHLRAVLITSWLLHDEVFGRMPAEKLLGLLKAGVEELSRYVMPRAFVEDADRREELVRTCLKRFKIAPVGESKADAEDRLSTLDSVKRVKLMKLARQREKAREKERRRKELAEIQRKQEEAKRQAARTTFED